MAKTGFRPGSKWGQSGSNIYNLNTGNVGIGTTTPESKLDVSGTSFTSGSFANSTDGVITVRGDDYTAGDITALDFAKVGFTVPHGRIALRHESAGSYLQFGTSNSYGAGITNTAMTIDPTGIIGVGTTSPASNSKLDVQGGHINLADANRLIWGNSTNNGLRFQSTTFTLTSGGVESFRSTNTYAIDTRSSNLPIRMGNNIKLLGRNVGNTADVNIIYLDASDKVQVGASDAVTITGGNVGFGNATPQAKISLGTDITGQKLLIYDSSNTRYGLGLASSILRIFAGTTGGISFGHVSTSDGSTYTESMLMGANGNLGLGTSVTSNGRLNLIASTSATGGIAFGTDTNLYRSAANTLRTNDSLIIDGTPQTNAGGYAGTSTQSLSTTLYDQSRLQNLVTNGSGLLRNNYNFSQFTFDATETHGGGGSFKSTVIQVAYLNDELISVDPEKYYRLAGWAMSGDTGGANFNATNRQYLGVAPIDIDGNTITPQYYSKHTGSTDTTLAVDLIPGATTMTLTDATGWSDGSSANHAQFGWWPYTNSFGYTYPNYTYTRNLSDTYSSNASLKTWTTPPVGNVITLRVAWAGPTLTAGTPVRNHSAGGTYKYIAASNANVPNAWTRYEGYIGTYDTAGAQVQTQFPYGTAYIKLLFLVNYPTSTGNTVRWSDIWFSEMSTRNLEEATATVPGVVSTSTQTFAGKKTFNNHIGIGNGALDDRGVNLTVSTATGTNYGVVNTVNGASTTNVGYYAQVTGATTNIGLNIVSTPDTSTNYAINSTAPAKSYFAGKMGLGTTSPTALLHLAAGTATANTAPLQFTSGTIETTARAGLAEYDGNFKLTKVNNIRVGVGGTLNVNTTAVGNVGIGEDNLISYSVPASTLSTDKDSLEFRAGGTIANNINAKRIKVIFGSTTIFDTGAAGIPVSAAIDWIIEGKIIRTGASAQKCIVTMNTNNATLASYADYTAATETLSGALTLKLTGEAVTDNDIVQELLAVEYNANI